MADADLEAIKARLTQLELKLNSDENRRVRALEKEQNERLSILDGLSTEGKAYKRLDRLISELTGYYLFQFTGFNFGRKLKEILSALFQYNFVFPKTTYRAKDEIDPNASDEDNIEKSVGQSHWWMAFSESDLFTRLLDDVLICLGRLAKNINSTAIPRIVALMARCEPFGSVALTNDPKEAESLAAEFINCMRIVNAELRLMQPEDWMGVFPARPVHDDEDVEEFDADQFSNNTDPCDATEAARDFAVEQYNKSFADVMPKDGAVREENHPLKYLSDSVRRMADEMENGLPTVDKRWWKLDTQKLARVLESDFDLRYENYETEDAPEDDEGRECVHLTHDTCWEETTEGRFKKLIVADLKRYISAGATIARTVGSPSLGDWARMLTLMEKYDGHFHDYFSAQALARKNLREFISALVRARDQIWGDVTAFGGVKPLIKNTDTSIKIGPYASKFVMKCDPGKGVFVIKDTNGKETEYRLSVNANKVWETLGLLVSAKSADGFVKLPKKWDARFKANIGSTSEIDPYNDINIVRCFIFRENAKKGRGSTGRFRLMPTPADGKMRELLKLRKRTKTPPVK